MNQWTNGKIININHITKKLFILKIKANINKFLAGQFCRFQIKTNGKIIQRAYSYINAPNKNYLKFYIILNKNGKMTPYLYNLKKGDIILISKKSSGNLTLENIPKCKNLWMISTGTGIGPFISILEYKKNIKHYKNIILINSVRYIKDLTLLNKINTLKKKYKKILKVILIISREKKQKYLYGRITKLFLNKTIENYINIKLNKKNSHVMMCGNPNMIYDMKKIFKNLLKMKDNTKNNLGQITSERYW